MRTEAEKQELRQTIKRNKHEVYILSLEEMDNVFKSNASSKYVKEQWGKLKNKVEFSANYTAAGNDAMLLAKLIGDLGYGGTKAYIKRYGGNTHIILKGHPGLRKILTGTKYGIQNAKVIKMGLGKYGAVNAAKGGGVLTIILLSTYRVVDYFLKDNSTLNTLIGTLATDVVKVGLATGASVIAGSSMAALGVALSSGAATGAFVGAIVVVGPLAAVIAVGLITSYVLSEADEKYRITENVIAVLDEIEEKGIRGIIDEKKQSLVNKGKDMANDAAESIIDYAVESTKRILARSLNKIYRKMVNPGIR